MDPTPFAGSSTTYTVAISDDVYQGSKTCGMCVSITDASGSQKTAFVNNECPSCDSTSVDLGLSGDGVFGISWQAIPCPVGSTKIQYFFQGSNSYFIKLQARNTKYPVFSVELLSGGNWISSYRTPDNFFQLNGGFPVTFPTSVRVTSVNGIQIVDTISSLQNGVVISGTQQF